MIFVVLDHVFERVRGPGSVTLLIPCMLSGICVLRRVARRCVVLRVCVCQPSTRGAGACGSVTRVSHHFLRAFDIHVPDDVRGAQATASVLQAGCRSVRH